MKLHNPVQTMRNALKFTEKKNALKITSAVHLDECGDVVSTDGYRMYVQHGAWEGESLNIEYAVAYAMSKRKLKGNDFAELTVNGNEVTVKMGDGFEFHGNLVEGKYPDHKRLMPDKHTAVAYIDPDRVLPVVREHVRLKTRTVLIATGNHKVRVQGYGENDKPSVELAQAGEGEGSIGFNPEYLKDALSIFKGIVDLRIDEPHKPAVFAHGDVELLVMPMRTEAAAKPKKQERKPTKATPDELRSAIKALAIDRAASDPDSKVKAANASAYERNLVHEHERAGQLTRKEANSFTSWYLNGEFLVCIERRWSQRKIHLTYPELKPIAHRSDMVASVLAERAAKEKAGANVKATVNDLGGGVTAVVMETKKEDAVAKEIEELKKQVEALKKEAASAKAETESWKRKAKAEEYYSAKPEKVEPKKAKKPNAITLAFMEAWAKERGLEAKQKNPEAAIWVLGNSKPYEKELKELGFRWARKSAMGAGWYAKPTA